MSGGKRRRDFEEDDGYRDFRPRMPKRQRVPPVVQLCKEMMPDIKTIGESVKAFDDDIKFLSEAIINEFDNEEYFRDALLNTFYAVVTEQPQKQAAIALLTMTVNAGNPIAGKSILNFFFSKLQNWCDATIDETFEAAANETGPWNKIKLITRFLSLLSPIVLEDELLSLYRKIFDLCVLLNDLGGEKRVPLSEAIYFNMLVNIPYLFFFQKQNESLTDAVFDLLSFVESNYKVKSTDLSLTKEYNGKMPYISQQLVQMVFPAVKRVLGHDMQQLIELFPDYDRLLVEQQNMHAFNDPLNLPAVERLRLFSGLDRGFGSVDGMWKTPRTSFKVYLPSTAGDFETVVPVNTYAGMLLNDIIIDIVEGMEFNRREVARQVITLDLFFKPGIFAEPGLSIAQLVSLYEENPIITTYKIEDLAIENILSLIFKLPNVSQSFAYFYTLLVEICQNSPKAIAPVFGRAFRFFYGNLDNLDMELKLRYLDWFSIQMSNFGFSWKWNEWEADVVKFGPSFYNPRVALIKNLIRKELRLTSNRPDVEDSLTDEFKQYLDTSYVPRTDLLAFYQSFFTGFSIEEDMLKDNDLLFKQGVIPGSAYVLRLLDYFHKQPLDRNVSEIEAIFKEMQDEFNSQIPNFNRFAVTVIAQALVYSGNRSLSHANKYIGDAKNELQEFLSKIDSPDEIKERWIVEAVLRFWNSNSQNGYLIADTFKNNDIISCESILSFSLLDDNGRNWGLVDATAIESTFRILSELALRKQTSVKTYAFVYERCLQLLAETAAGLGVSEDEEIKSPIIDDETMMDLPSELPKLDLIWKYEAILGLLKSILRKYSDEFVLMQDKLITECQNNLSHHPTQALLTKWIEELVML
ncbi:LAMI_0G00232g1_1 [Lachancea mirantina]|uniref:Nuclear cap-binding protein complex subunit 1 n=1 Tax=Lachancea mirantina TaxID=1230905 RepID=A0A1G4K715_9SACH|nr:LAMI_0G00232g1_1 [Lachancea mirantina]